MREQRVPLRQKTDPPAFDGEVIVLERGAVVQRARQAELAANPATDFVRQFWNLPPAPR